MTQAELGSPAAGHYARGVPNWSHAFAVVRVWDDGRYDADLRLIIDGRALVRGHEIRA